MNHKTYHRGFLGIPPFFALILIAFIASPPKPLAEAANKESADVQNTKRHTLEAYGKLPLSFEVNAGQTDNQVKFLSRGDGHTLFLTRNAETVLMFNAPIRNTPAHSRVTPAAAAKPQPESATPAVVRMKLVNANLNPEAEGLDQLPGHANYIIGNDSKKWRTNVPLFTQVKYHEVYRGVDLAYYGNQQQLEYDFIVAPHADISSVTMAIEGEESSLNTQGDLLLAGKGWEVAFQKPVAYQMVDGDRREIPSRYLRKGAHRIGFEVGAYDHDRPLIIDPVFAYSTYLGAGAGRGIAIDSSGNAYVVGVTSVIDFPVTPGAFQTTGPGTTSCGLGGSQCREADAFVAKLNPAGSALVYATYLGGSANNYGQAIAVDSAGNAYVTGFTSSTDFPTTPGSFQPVLRTMNGYNTFVTKVNPSGTGLVYSTYLGGSGGYTGLMGEKIGGDQAQSIVVDGDASAYVTGSTDSIDFPVTPLAFQPINRAATNGQAPPGYNVFITKLHSSGSLLVYSTFLGGSMGAQARGIAVDSNGNAYITGNAGPDFPTTPGAFQPAAPGGGDAFVTKLDPLGSALLYSTFLGGSTGSDSGQAIAVDQAGNVYVTGTTCSSDFPVTLLAPQMIYQGNCDAFVTKLNPAEPAGPLSGILSLVYSTYAGGKVSDYGAGIAVDSAGNAFVAGTTQSSDFPTTANAIQPTLGGATGRFNAFVLAVNPQGTAFVYSSYLGGNYFDQGMGIALDASGNAYITGSASSPNFPTTPGSFQTTLQEGQSAFVTKVAGIAQ